MLERCLASVRPFVDEVNVWENGSRDGTVELLDRLAAEPGAPIRVERGEWLDDFSWAREQSFRMASDGCEWLLWLDADDVLVGGDRLRDLVANCPHGVDGFEIEYDAGRYANGVTAQFPRERLVRAGRLCWTAPLHEHLVPVEDRELRYQPVPAARVHVRHLPPATKSAAAIAAPIILETQRRRDLAEHGRLSLWLLFWSGMTFAYSGQPEKAVLFLGEYLEGLNTGAPLGPRTRLPMNDPQWRTFAHLTLGPHPPTPGRNDPCACGSGVKFKRCCGK